MDYGRFAEEVRREFGKLPVYVGVEDGLLYVKPPAALIINSSGATYRRVRGLASVSKAVGG